MSIQACRYVADAEDAAPAARRQHPMQGNLIGPDADGMLDKLTRVGERARELWLEQRGCANLGRVLLE